MNRVAFRLILLAIAIISPVLSNGCGGTNQNPEPEINKQNVSVTISPSSATLLPSQSQPFKAAVSGTSNTAVSWSVDNIPGGNTSVGTISNKGDYTAPSSAGKHTILATSDADPTKSASAAVTVKSPAASVPAVLTERFDSTRSGTILTETILNPSNVNSKSFGRIASYGVDGYILTQPLYVPGLAIPGQGTFNVTFVATEHDSVYAFDADGKQPSPLWKRSLIDPANGVTPVPQADVNSTIYPEIGITGTPVIDLNSKTMYLVAFTKENGNYFQRLHALDITTGNEKFGGPIAIQATVSGTGVGNDGNGNVPFQPKIQLQRASLLLLKGVVYIAWSSHGDNGPYHGWITAYDAATLKSVAVWNTTPNGDDGAIWQSGAGLSADSQGFIYAVTANGHFDADSGGRDYGDSIVKLTLNGSAISVVDYFSPFNQAVLAADDNDFGSAGIALIPGTRLGTAAGKDGGLFLVNLDKLGHYDPKDNSVVLQYIPGAIGTAFTDNNFSTAAYFNGNVYYIGENDFVRQFQLSGGLLSTFPVHQSGIQYGKFGAQPVVSANGSGNGILWAVEYVTGGGNGVLHAYDANDVSKELYNSNQAGSRDNFGAAAKFSVPTIINGKVFVGGQSKLAIFANM